MSDFETVTVTDVPADAKILDVREDYEWAAGHAEGALHIPLDQLPARLSELDPDEDLYRYLPDGRTVLPCSQVACGPGIFRLQRGRRDGPVARVRTAARLGQRPQTSHPLAMRPQPPLSAGLPPALPPAGRP